MTETLAPPDRRFIEGLAKLEGIDPSYVLQQVAGSAGVEEGRLVALRLGSYAREVLDVSALDALKKLTVRGPYGANGKIAGALREVALGKHPRLVELDLDDNAVSSIDLSGCPRLEVLKLARNGLKALPARLPQTLRTLGCADNPLGTLVLRSDALETLLATRCSLEALDLSGLPALTTLECAFNRLAVLDLRASKRLRVLWCQANGGTVTLPARAPLRVLSIGRNPRTRLDAGRYAELETLFVDDTGLRELTLANPKLDHLDCSNGALETLDLSSVPRLAVLTASANPLRKLDLRPLGRLRELEIDAQVAVQCSELQKHVLPVLRERFGLPKPAKTIAKMDGYQLHAFVQGYNWDDGEKRLFDVIRHPACLLATALLVYWQSEPEEHAAYRSPKEAPREHRKTVELLREIEAGVKSDRFAEGLVPFDLRDVDGVDLSVRARGPSVPAFMKVAVRPRKR